MPANRCSMAKATATIRAGPAGGVSSARIPIRPTSIVQ
jgi:hypothetical protein